MNKPSLSLLAAACLIGLAGLVLALGLALKGAGEKTTAADTLTITADDGTAELTVDPNTLPADVTPDQITITRAAIKVSAGESGAEPSLIYILKPNGLTLSAPATLTITREQPDTRIPLAVHLTSAGLSPLANTNITLDQAEKKLTVTTDLDHFSDIALFDFFAIDLEVPKTVQSLHEPFTARTTVSQKQEQRSLHLSEETVTTRIVQPWSLTGSFGSEPLDKFGAFLEPRTVTNAPAKREVNRPPQHREERTFICKNEGHVTVTYTARLDGDYAMTIQPADQKKLKIKDEDFFIETVTVRGSPSVECLAGGFPAPSPDPSPLRDSAAPATAAPAPTARPKSSAATMDVLIIGGRPFPIKQFAVSEPDACASQHYHAPYEVSSVDLSTHLSDPNAGGCGFGTVAQVSRQSVSITAEQEKNWQD